MRKCAYCGGFVRGSKPTAEKFCSLRCQNRDEGWKAALEPIRKMVNAQAEDEGLWCKITRASEAYLQQELRKLHALVEKQGKP